MNSQNTPVHIRLWHHDFWRMAIANLLLTAAVYMLVPTMPQWLLETQGLSSLESGLVMAAFGTGLFVFGVFVSFLVQHYRRNVVCMWAVIALAVLLGMLYYIDMWRGVFVDFWYVLFLRFGLGAVFGLAQMVLTSTLIIDTCESYQRTEANYSAGWFGRFALSIGPLAGLLLQRMAGFESVLLVAGGVAVVAVVLIRLVNFPFRAPEDDIPTVSLDRFFLPHGFPLFFNLQLITLAVGLLLSLPLHERFYAMMMVGFLLALLAQRFVFRDAEVKSEVVSGLILLGAALLMMLTHPQPMVWYIAPVFVGFSLGIIGSRFMLFFIKLSRHCQRGTSQSTFMLGWESGIAWGLGFGLAFFQDESGALLIAALVLVVCALVLYHFTHNWFIKNKNR
jgi:MFS family permease